MVIRPLIRCAQVVAEAEIRCTAHVAGQPAVVLVPQKCVDAAAIGGHIVVIGEVYAVLCLHLW